MKERQFDHQLPKLEESINDLVEAADLAKKTYECNEDDTHGLCMRAHQAVEAALQFMRLAERHRALYLAENGYTGS